MARVARSVSSLTSELTAAASAIKALTAELYPQVAVFDRYKDKLNEIDQAAKLKVVGPEVADKLRAALRQSFDLGPKGLESLGAMKDSLIILPPEKLKSLQDSVRVIGKTTTDVADETDAATVRIAKSFGDMADDTINALQNMSNSIRSGDFLSILGSAVKLFTQLGKTGLFGETIKTNVNSVTTRHANGTGFHPGGLALVGERGPEIIQLPRGTSVYRNGTGPGGSQFNFDLRGAVVTQDLLNQMNAIGAVAAQAGGEIGYRKVAQTASRRLS